MSKKSSRLQKRMRSVLENSRCRFFSLQLALQTGRVDHGRCFSTVDHLEPRHRSGRPTMPDVLALKHLDFAALPEAERSNSTFANGWRLVQHGPIYVTYCDVMSFWLVDGLIMCFSRRRCWLCWILAFNRLTQALKKTGTLFEASCEFRLWCQMMPLEWSWVLRILRVTSEMKMNVLEETKCVFYHRIVCNL